LPAKAAWLANSASPRLQPDGRLAGFNALVRD
jgi:hypothetical protein